MSEILELEARIKNFVSAELVKIQKDLKGVSDSQAQVKKSSSALTTSFGSLAMGLLPVASATGAVIFAFREMSKFAKESQEIAKIQIEVNQKLSAVLKSTGGAAGLTYEELKKLSSGLQIVTTFGDEAIDRANALLLTFTNIGRDIFPDATETVLNMSAALGQDLKSSAIQLGKALQDPIIGATALRRVGVNLTDQQMEQIKAFTELGELEKAQKLILQELKVEFGGVARAMAETDVGKIEQATNKLNDQKELLGTELIKLTKELKSAQLDLATIAIPALVNATKTLLPLFKGLSTTIGFITDNSENVGKYFEIVTTSALNAVPVLGDVVNLLRIINDFRGKGTEETIGTTSTGELEKSRQAYEENEKKKSAAKEAAIKIDLDKTKAWTDEVLKLTKEGQIKLLQSERDTKLKEVVATEEGEKQKQLIRQFYASKIKEIQEQLTSEAAKAYDAEFKAFDDNVTAELDVARELYDKETELENALKELKELNATEIKELQQQLNEEEIESKQNKYDREYAALAEWYRQQKELHAENAQASGLVDQLYAKKRKKIDTEVAEESKEKSDENAENSIRNQQYAANTTFGIMRNIASATKADSATKKTLDIAQATANTYMGATAAIAKGQLWQVPLVIGMGLTQVAMIAAQKYAGGGVVPGNSFTGDKVPSMLNSGEMILNGYQTANLFDMLNRPNGATTNTTSNIALNIHVGTGANYDMAAARYTVDKLVPVIGEALVRAKHEGRLRNYENAR